MMAMLRTLLTLGHVTFLRLKPTDVILVEVNRDNIDQDTAERLKRVMKEAFGEDRKIIVMQKGMKITIYERVVIINEK